LALRSPSARIEADHRAAPDADRLLRASRFSRPFSERVLRNGEPRLGRGSVDQTLGPEVVVGIGIEAVALGRRRRQGCRQLTAQLVELGHDPIDAREQIRPGHGASPRPHSRLPMKKCGWPAPPDLSFGDRPPHRA